VSSLAAPNARPADGVEGEFAFTAEDFRAIAAVLHRETGIFLTESKTTLVYSRLAKRLRKLGIASFKDYRKLLASESGADERVAMMSALTTNLTRFYREPHHFDHLRSRLLEPMAQSVRQGARLRLWSAACSTGEEAYSMALTVLSVLPDAPELDVRILATDIDPVVVGTAEAGEYSSDAVAPIPAALRERYMEGRSTEGGARGDRKWSVGAAARSLIIFNELNLIQDWPMRGRFDAIFCRNVVIYFDDETQARLWPRFAAALNPTGRLYIGHSERIGDTAFENDGLTVYRLKAGRGR
jgi:chemotaxis protein methyltransferase CheR